MSDDPGRGASVDDPGPASQTGEDISRDLTILERTAPEGPIGPVGESSVTMEDRARLVLAGSLLALLAAVVIGSGWTVLNFPGRQPAVEGYLQIVFAPIVGLVGSVIGFYFGSRASSGAARRGGR